MTLFQAELKYFLRSPLIWFIAAVFAFISAWSFMLYIDLFQQNQIKFAQMSDAPSIYEGIIFPAIMTQAKLMVIVVSIIGGLSFSRYSNNNGWSLIQQIQYSDWQVIKDKFLACLATTFLFLLPLLMACLLLIVFTQLNVLSLLVAFLGLIVLVIWMLSLTLLISSMSVNSGFAILMNLILLVLLFILSQSTIDISWGKNWIQSLSPHYHFQQFLSPYLSIASLYYFIVGTLLLLLACRMRLLHKRTQL